MKFITLIIIMITMCSKVTYAGDLIITGVIDATLSGGTPKAIEIYAVNDVDDLSACGIGFANNGGGTDGEEFTFTASDSINAGEFFYISNEITNFEAFFGFSPNYKTGLVAINGDDAVELFCNGIVIDTFGDIEVDGTDQPWEYLNGWAYRKPDTGPDFNTFSLDNWAFSGVDALDSVITNTSAPTPFPIAYFFVTEIDDTEGDDTEGGDTEGGDTEGDDTEVEDTEMDEAPIEELTIGICAADATFISAIQGNDETSPFIGEVHVVEAVVTGSFYGLSGFFIQEENIDMDDDNTTSEGIFVSYHDTLPPVGNVIRVLGIVGEAFNKTQITATEILTNCGTETANTTAFTLPFKSLSETESIEGMLVTSNQQFVVTDNFALGHFGEVTLSSKRLFTPTNIEIPGSDEAITLEATNALDSILLDDANNEQNPDFVPFPIGGLSEDNTLRIGDSVTNVTGIIDYNFDSYRIIPTIAPTFILNNTRTSEPTIKEGNLKIASLNVLNYFNGLNTNENTCGPQGTSDCRGAEDEIELQRQKAKTIAAIVAMDADILGLMEIENNGFDENSAIVDLINEVNKILGNGMYKIVNPGSPIGTDAITVALIYKQSVVIPTNDSLILSSDNSISDDAGVLFDDSQNRPSLIQKFTLLQNNEYIAVSVNHFKSKGSLCGENDDDVTTGQGNCNLTRTRAAQALTAFISAEFPEIPVLIIGDLNSYAKEDPIVAIESAGYTNLINNFDGDEAYSYSFNGQSGYLDHALANESALEKVIDVTEWHINADEPISFDYNTNFKSESQILNYYAANPYRMSDHDPIIISLQLDSVPIVRETQNFRFSTSSLELLTLILLVTIMLFRKRL